MKGLKKVCLFVFWLGFNLLSNAQRDPYINHNKLIQNTAQGGGYYLIGPYKVQGSPYFNKDTVLGTFYSKTETVLNIYLRYELFNQNLEFISSANKEQALVKEIGELDSFLLFRNEKKGIKEDLKFVDAKMLGVDDKAYYCVLYKGPKYSIYKRYTSELIIPLAKAGIAEMREFETQVEYWYMNEITKELIKLAPTAGAVKKEFRDVKDLSTVLKGLSMFNNPDKALKKTFIYLNE